MERILQSAPFTASMLYTEDGAAVDPGTVTVGVTRDDGTVLVAAGTATSGGTGVQARTFNITIANTTLLDRLTVTWTSSAKGNRVSTLEVVGGFLFSIAQLRAKGFSDTSVYPTANVVNARLYAEAALEDACDQAFVPRYSSYIFTGQGYRSPVYLPKRNIRLIRSASSDGLALGVADIAALQINTSRGAVYGRVWPWSRTCVIRYEYGDDYPPMDITMAALDLATFILPQVTSVPGVDPRAESVITEDGTMRFALGSSGRFGIPSVDRVVGAYQRPLVG